MTYLIKKPLSVWMNAKSIEQKLPEKSFELKLKAYIISWSVISFSFSLPYLLDKKLRVWQKIGLITQDKNHPGWKFKSLNF